MSEYTEIQGFAVSDGTLADAIVNLVHFSALAELVEMRSLPDMVGPGQVVEFENVSGRPVYTWSSGEQILWNLVTSVAGRSEVNLSQVVSFFAPCPERPYIAAVLAAVWEA